MCWTFGTDAVMERREVAEAMWVAARQQMQNEDDEDRFSLDFGSLWYRVTLTGHSTRPEGLGASKRWLQRSGHTAPDLEEETNFSLSDKFKLASSKDGSLLVRQGRRGKNSQAAQQQQLDRLVAAGRSRDGAPRVAGDTGFLISQPPLHVELLKVTDTRTMLAMSLVCRGLRCASLELLRREQAAWCGEEYVPLSGGCKKKDPASMGGMSLKACRHRRILSLLCGTPEAGAVFESAVGTPRLEHGNLYKKGRCMSSTGGSSGYNDMDTPLSQLRRTRLSQHSPHSYFTKAPSHDDRRGGQKLPPSRVIGSILQVLTFNNDPESPDYLEYLPAEHVGVLLEVRVWQALEYQI